MLDGLIRGQRPSITEVDDRAHAALVDGSKRLTANQRAIDVAVS
jgi:hypothetical protein